LICQQANHHLIVCEIQFKVFLTSKTRLPNPSDNTDSGKNSSYLSMRFWEADSALANSTSDKELLFETSKRIPFVVSADASSTSTTPAKVLHLSPARIRIFASVFTILSPLQAVRLGVRSYN
jgi:hypothetical protein